MDAAMAKARRGTVMSSGLHRTAVTAAPPKPTMTRYHSGIVGSAQNTPGAGWYRDWNGPLPQTPWYIRPLRQWNAPLPYTRPAQVRCPAELYFWGHFLSSNASASPYPRCCFQFREADRHRATRGVGNPRGGEAIAGHGDIRPPHPRMRGGGKGAGQIGQPAGVRGGIVVDIGDDLPGGRFQTDIPGDSQAAVAAVDEADGVLTCDGWGGIRGSIVDDDHLVVWIPQLLQTFEASADGACAVITAHDDRDARPSHIRWKR